MQNWLKRGKFRSLLYKTNHLNATCCQGLVPLRASLSAHAPELLHELHWLPIRQRVRFKLAVVTFKAKHSGLLAYLHDDLQYMTFNLLECCRLPLQSAHLLYQPLILVLTSIASRAFTVAAPTAWNSPSVNTQVYADNFANVKSKLIESNLSASIYTT